jgi:chromosomal replication initiation ATPase DnaA
MNFEKINAIAKTSVKKMKTEIESCKAIVADELEVLEGMEINSEIEFEIFSDLLSTFAENFFTKYKTTAESETYFKIARAFESVYEDINGYELHE